MDLLKEIPPSIVKGIQRLSINKNIEAISALISEIEKKESNEEKKILYILKRIIRGLSSVDEKTKSTFGTVLVYLLEKKEDLTPRYILQIAKEVFNIKESSGYSKLEKTIYFGLFFLYSSLFKAKKTKLFSDAFLFEMLEVFSHLALKTPTSNEAIFRLLLLLSNEQKVVAEKYILSVYKEKLSNLKKIPPFVVAMFIEKQKDIFLSENSKDFFFSLVQNTKSVLESLPIIWKTILSAMKDSNGHLLTKKTFFFECVVKSLENTPNRIVLFLFFKEITMTAENPFLLCTTKMSQQMIRKTAIESKIINETIDYLILKIENNSSSAFLLLSMFLGRLDKKTEMNLIFILKEKELEDMFEIISSEIIEKTNSAILNEMFTRLMWLTRKNDIFFKKALSLLFDLAKNIKNSLFKRRLAAYKIEKIFSEWLKVAIKQKKDLLSVLTQSEYFLESFIKKTSFQKKLVEKSQENTKGIFNCLRFITNFLLFRKKLEKLFDKDQVSSLKNEEVDFEIKPIQKENTKIFLEIVEKVFSDKKLFSELAYKLEQERRAFSTNLAVISIGLLTKEEQIDFLFKLASEKKTLSISLIKRASQLFSNQQRMDLFKKMFSKEELFFDISIQLELFSKGWIGNLDEQGILFVSKILCEYCLKCTTPIKETNTFFYISFIFDERKNQLLEETLYTLCSDFLLCCLEKNEEEILNIFLKKIIKKKPTVAINFFKTLLRKESLENEKKFILLKTEMTMSFIKTLDKDFSLFLLKKIISMLEEKRNCIQTTKTFLFLAKKLKNKELMKNFLFLVEKIEQSKKKEKILSFLKKDKFVSGVIN